MTKLAKFDHPLGYKSWLYIVILCDVHILMVTLNYNGETSKYINVESKNDFYHKMAKLG